MNTSILVVDDKVNVPSVSSRALLKEPHGADTAGSGEHVPALLKEREAGRGGSR